LGQEFNAEAIIREATTLMPKLLEELDNAGLVERGAHGPPTYSN
jgi:hypothetical protein